jgi:hypothetical protein
MSEPRAAIVRFVRAVVRVERAGNSSGDDAEVAGRVVMRMHRELSKLIGSGGFDVLLARSVVLASRTHRALAGIAAGPGGTLTGLDAASRDAALGEGAMAIVAHFIDLLATLIGEDLALALVRKAWPAVDEEEEK